MNNNRAGSNGKPDAEQGPLPVGEGQETPGGEPDLGTESTPENEEQNTPDGEPEAEQAPVPVDEEPVTPDKQPKPGAMPLQEEPSPISSRPEAEPTATPLDKAQETPDEQLEDGLVTAPPGQDPSLASSEPEPEAEPTTAPADKELKIPDGQPGTGPVAAPPDKDDPVASGETGAEPAALAAETNPTAPNPEGAAAAATSDVQSGTGTAEAIPADVMPLMEHLKELRGRLMWAVGALLVATAISFVFAKQVLVILIAPMGDSIPQALKPTESLGNYMKVSLIMGVTLAMPMIVYQIGAFLSPGLTKQEKRWLYVLVPGATVCFITGVAFAYFVMLPTAIPFLQGFMADIIEQSWAIGEYLSFVTSLLLWIGLAFELPLFVFFLAKLGLVNAEMLSRNRKYAYLVIAVIAAIITPTVDPINMLLVMGPLVLLYELGVLLARIA
jgi:sec-independent protein translocase protein TatC